MQYTNDLDKLRDENFAQVFPELADAVNKTLAEAQTKND
jgi:hypothetical protein